MLPLATAHMAHLCAKAHTGVGGLNHPPYRSDVYHSKYRLIAQNKRAPPFLSYQYEIFNYSK